MYTIFHITKNLDGFLVLGMRGLKIEETADHRQIVLDPVMDLLQQGILSFLASAQFGSPLFSCFRLANEVEDMRHSERKHGRSGERNGRGEEFDGGRQDINGYPDCDHFHEVGSATTKNEKSKRQEHPVIRNIPSPLVSEVPQRDGDRQIRNPNERIRDYMGPHQPRIPQIAKCMWQEIRR